jgi:hypothetical protein
LASHRLSRSRQPSRDHSCSSRHDDKRSNRLPHHRQSHSRSRPRARPSTNYSTEIGPRRSVYLRDIHRSYHQLVDEQVKIPLHTANSGIKLSSIRVPLPKAYSGDEDIEQFDGWLHSMLQWMKINHYTGPERERDRIMLTAMYLDEKAKTWFNDNVEGINHQRWVWTFKDVITGLYDQFIHESSIQDATQKFYSVKYTTDGGVFGFYHELERYALRMIHEPDSYMFNTQLMMGLLSNMIRSVVDKGVTAETSTLNEILHMAKCVKEGTKVIQRYDDCR